MLTRLGEVGVGIHGYYVNIQAATKKRYTGRWRWLAWSYTPTVGQSTFLGGLLGIWAVLQGTYWSIDAILGYKIVFLQWLLFD